MSRALIPQLIASRNVTVRKTRELPILGDLLVKVGDSVKADQIVARAALPGELFIVRAPEQTGLQSDEILSSLKVKEGDVVKEGDILCLHPGPFAGMFRFFETVLTSPCSGVVEFITERTAHIGIRAPSIPLELSAYISGRIVKVDDKKSVTIETNASMLQGIFGVGGERLGILKFLKVATDHPLTQEDIPSDCAGKILVGGMCPTAEALLFAQARGALGLITGSIDDTALKKYLGYDLGIALTGDEPVTMTVIVTEGFGKMPLSARVPELLESFEGRWVSINGATQVRAGAERPEIIVPENEGGAPSSPTSGHGLEVGSLIRIIRVPYFGKTARVTALPQELERIETGAETRVLYATLESGEEVRVPRANVEMV